MNIPVSKIKIEKVKKQNSAKDKIINDVKFALQARANFKKATEKYIKPIEQKYITLELDKLPLTKAKSERLNSLRCKLRKGWDDVGTYLITAQLSTSLLL